MGLDELHLRVLATASDDEKERRDAQKGKALNQTCGRDLIPISAEVDGAWETLGACGL